MNNRWRGSTESEWVTIRRDVMRVCGETDSIAASHSQKMRQTAAINVAEKPTGAH